MCRATHIYGPVLGGLWDSWVAVNSKCLLVPGQAKEQLLWRPAVLPAEGSNLQRTGKPSHPREDVPCLLLPHWPVRIKGQGQSQ